jgi:uncharacterized protein
MLTREHAIVVFDRDRAIPDRLTRKAHGHYADYARRMLAVYGAGVGATRRDLHRWIEGIFTEEPDCPSRRIQAFAKLLDDESDFETDPRGQAARLRLAVFGMAAEFHPLVRTCDRLFERSEEETKARIAAELGRPWAEIEAGLYADLIEFQRLAVFRGYPSPEAFLSRYNVAQVQACLYRAERMIVTAAADFKTILRYAKLAGLLHEIRRLGPEKYRIELSGPASVLRTTRRYGVNLARFVPALLACNDWTMEAAMKTPWGSPARLVMSHRDGLTSHLPSPEEFDSSVEEAFVAKFGEVQAGWRLSREAAILEEGQHTYVPDFVFRHDDGTAVLFEIVGFWTPEYLAKKRETLLRFRRHKILVAVEAHAVQDDAQVPEGMIVYKKTIKLEPVLEALERVRAEKG